MIRPICARRATVTHKEWNLVFARLGTAQRNFLCS